MFAILISLISLTTATHPVVLPIRWSESWEPITQIVVGKGSKMDVVLTMGTLLSGISPSNWFPNKSLRLAFPSCPEVTMRYERTRHPLSLGVGPTSPIIAHHRSASILTDPSRFVLGLSESQFAETCISESVIAIPITQRDDESFGIYASVQLGDGADDESSESSHFTGPWDYSPSIDIFSRLRLPRSIFDDIINFLISNGARKTGMINRLQNCHPTIIDKIPALSITFYGSPVDQMLPYISTIYLDMSNYIEYRPETNTCIFQFSVSSSNTEPWGVAPFSLPDKNVFVNRNRLLVCDVRAAEETPTTTAEPTTEESSTTIVSTTSSTADQTTTSPAPRRSLPIRMLYGLVGGIGAVLEFIGNDLKDHYINGFR
jgi:hypothetical protein